MEQNEMIVFDEVEAREVFAHGDAEEIDTSVFVTDGVKLYLKQIGNIPLLSAEEEYALAIRISEGDKEAVSILAEHNLRLVVSIAKKYCGCGMPFLDLKGGILALGICCCLEMMKSGVLSSIR